MNIKLQGKINCRPNRLTIAAPQGRSGKTTVCVGLCAAYRLLGMQVQPFKKGPDYIDPSWLTAAAGRKCLNLDTVLIPDKVVVDSFTEAATNADVAIIEGAMGLYDSFDPIGKGSTASLARLLKSPILLVVNATHMTRSVAALVRGYQNFEPGTHIAGIILNNVAGSRHEQKLITAIKQYCGIPVVGSLPRDEKLNLTERHMGLIPYDEIQEQSIIETIALLMKRYLNLDEILNIAKCAGDLESTGVKYVERIPKQVKIGVIKDQAFTFYYPENLACLERAGAELVFIDSMRDSLLPDIDALYIGGGFPELFLPQLEANWQLRQNIARAIESYLPVYAECAGLMYLCQSISWRGKNHPMVGIIPAAVELLAKPQGHGYVKVEVIAENPFFPVGSGFWGHEFHYSKLVCLKEVKQAYRVLRGQGILNGMDGIYYKNLLASYVHLHALGVPQWAESFCRLALRHKDATSGLKSLVT